MRERPQTRHQRERGAVFVFVAITLTTLITFAAIAIDLGYQRLARRDAQAIADVIALDLALHLDHRTAAEVLNDPAFATTLSESRTRNNFPVAGNNVVTVAVGRVDPNTHQFVQTPCSMPPGGQAACSDEANAVQVTVQDTAVQRFFSSGAGSVQRTAVAVRHASGCFQLGSFALGLNSQSNGILNQLLGGALGTPPSLTVLGYQGLATAEVGLGPLATQLGLASPEQLATHTTTLGDFYVAAINALEQEDPSSVEAQLLQDAVDLNRPVLDQPITVGDLVSVDNGGADAAAAASMNLLDIVAGGLLLADGDHALNLTGLGINIGGLVTSSVTATLVEAIRTKCGPIGATQSTDQIRLDVALAVNISLSILSVARVEIAVDMDSASGTATLSDVTCSSDGTQQTALVDTTNGLAELGADARVSLLGIPGPWLPLVALNLPGQPEQLTFNVPPALPQSQTFGQSDAGLSSPNLGLLGNALIAAAVGPILATLDTMLITPLLQLVGADLSGGTVIMQSIDCQPRRLVQ